MALTSFHTQSARRRHPQPTEIIFRQFLELGRSTCGDYALHTMYRQQDESMAYVTNQVALPATSSTWASLAASYTPARTLEG